MGLVIWQVHNNSGSALTNVELADFTPAVADIQLEIQSGEFSDLSTGPIPDGHRRTIPGFFLGRLGDVYNYDIKVDGHVAADFQLEI